MIKKAIAVLACLSIVFAFSACKDDEKSSDSSKTTTTTTEATTKSTEESNTKYEVETTDAKDNNAKIVDGVIDNPNYTIEVGDNWDLSSGGDTMAFLTKKGENAVDSSENISIMFSDQFAKMSVDECVSSFKTQYEGIEDYKIISAEATKIGDYDASEIVLTSDVSGITAKLKQVCIIGEKGGALITYTALEDAYDKNISDIDKMLATIELK